MSKQNMTMSLEPDTIEKLRELAGGERKVGALVKKMTTLLWDQKALLVRVPLEDLKLRDDYVSDEIEELNKRLIFVEGLIDDLVPEGIKVSLVHEDGSIMEWPLSEKRIKRVTAGILIDKS